MSFSITTINHDCDGQLESIWADEPADAESFTWRHGNQEGFLYCPYCAEKLPETWYSTVTAVLGEPAGGHP